MDFRFNLDTLSNQLNLVSEEVNQEILLDILCENTLEVVNDLYNNTINSNLLNTSYSEKKAVDAFEVTKPAKITLKEYFLRIINNCEVENSTLLLTFILIDKLSNTRKIKLQYNNIHKIGLAAFYCAIKINEDYVSTHSFYAKIFSISVKELTKLEFFFIELLDYKLFINSTQYSNYSEGINKIIKKKIKKQIKRNMKYLDSQITIMSIDQCSTDISNSSNSNNSSSNNLSNLSAF